MKPKKFNEFKVDVIGGKVDYNSKRLTARGSVVIHEHEAEINNSRTRSTKLFYELAETEPEQDLELAAAKAKADEFGIKYSPKISLENLKTKIETYQK